MTAKDFRLIAGVLANDMPETLTEPQRALIVNAFARALRGTNGAFDHQRFYDAAMGTPQTKRDAPGYRL